MSRTAVSSLALRYQGDVYAALELYEERAAIREYCGGVKRGAAEQGAIEDVEADLVRRFTLRAEVAPVVAAPPPRPARFDAGAPRRTRRR